IHVSPDGPVPVAHRAGSVDCERRGCVTQVHRAVVPPGDPEDQGDVAVALGRSGGRAPLRVARSEEARAQDLAVAIREVLALHLDGLADCLDGLVGRDAEHRLSIMRDSRIGAFGAVGLILFLLLEIAAVAELPAGLRWRALLVVPALARATPPLLARCFRAAKVEGHGAAFRSGLRAGAAPVALVPALALVWAGLGVAGLLGAGAALVAALALA